MIQEDRAMETIAASPTKDELIEGLAAILNDMIQDWDLDLDAPITAETQIIDDLGFESIDLVQLVVAVEQKYGTRDIPYEELIMEDGRYVTEVTVDQLATFLFEKMNA